MKTLLFLLFLFCLSPVGAVAQEPEPGIYSGYISVNRSNKALRLHDVTTLRITIELSNNGPNTPWFLVTVRNLNQTGRLKNLWSEYSPDFALLPTVMPDIVFGNDFIRIPGGTTIPGSFKMTSKSLSLRCKGKTDSTHAWRKIDTTTTFSIRRIGPSPAPDQ